MEPHPNSCQYPLINCPRQGLYVFNEGNKNDTKEIVISPYVDNMECWWYISTTLNTGHLELEFSNFKVILFIIINWFKKIGIWLIISIYLDLYALTETKCGHLELELSNFRVILFIIIDRLETIGIWLITSGIFFTYMLWLTL